MYSTCLCPNCCSCSPAWFEMIQRTSCSSMEERASDLLFGEVHRRLHSQSHAFFCLFNLELAQNWKCQCYIKIFVLFLNPLNVLFISKFRSCSLCLVPWGSSIFSHKTQLFLVTLSYLFYVLQVETKMSYKRSKHVWTKDFSACFSLQCSLSQYNNISFSASVRVSRCDIGV